MRSNHTTADAGGGTGVDVSGLEFLAGLDELVRCADGTVPALVLAGFLDSVDVAALDTDAEVLDVVAATTRLKGWVEALHYRAVAEFVRRPVHIGVEDPLVAKAARRPVGEVARDFGGGDEVAAVLGLTVRGGEERVGTALALAGDFPATLAALAAGRIDHPRMSALLEEAAVLAGGRRGTPGQFRKARAEQYVRVGPSQTDTAWLDAHLSAEDAMAVRLALDAAATSMSQNPAESRSRDQLRAAALAAPFWAALATGQLHGPDGPIPLAVAHGQAPALELVVDDTDPASIPDLGGYGPITAGLGQSLTARAGNGPFPIVRVSRALTSQQSAQVAGDWPVETSYRPSAALVRHITARDRTCTHPACSTPAARTDLDHTLAWPHGPTHPANLAAVCRRHHQHKQHPAVRLRQPAPGHLLWTMPTGHRYAVGPPADDG